MVLNMYRKYHIYKNGSLFTEEIAVIRRWTEHCRDLNKYELRPEMSKLNNATNSNSTCGETLVLQDEVEGLCTN